MLFDTPSSLTIVAITDWYAVCIKGLDDQRQNALNVARKNLLIPSHLVHLINYTESQIEKYFDSCRDELDISAALVIIASAEARVRLDAEKRCKNKKDSLGIRLSRIMSASKWKTPLYERGILQAWKECVQKDLSLPRVRQDRLINDIGRYKNALEFRHWVAHGRYWNKPPIPCSPPVAASIIIKMYDCLSDICRIGNLGAFR